MRTAYITRSLIATLIYGSISLSISAQTIPDFSQYKANKLAGAINSSSEEAKPILSEDGKKLYFVRAFHNENVSFDHVPNNEDIWVAEKDDTGNWSKVNHETQLNDEKNNSIIGKGLQDHFFLLNTYQDKKHLDYGIALTRKTSENQWSTPKVIPIPSLKYDGDFYDFYITHDETVLLISIKGEDSYGQEDLYVSLKDGNGEWKKPINLGKIINSTGFEMSPFITEDKKHLYFSTNGRLDGYGDADIYVSERLDDTWTNWSTPLNLGKNINSDKMDCYFTIGPESNIYFSSNRNASSLDLYSASMPSVAPDVQRTALPAMSVTRVDTVRLTDTIIVYQTSNTPTTELPAVPNAIRVQYDSDQAQPVRTENQKLTDLYQTLSQNQKLRIILHGNTDHNGSDEYNILLSYKRVEHIKSFLIQKGIDQSRIVTSVFGENNPIATNENEKGREQNRRVDINFFF